MSSDLVATRSRPIAANQSLIVRTVAISLKRRLRLIKRRLPSGLSVVARARKFTVAFMVVITLTSLPDVEQRGRIFRPRIVLWAWERPEDLRFINPKNVGVAFLAGTLYLDATTNFRPRMQPLRISPETKLIAVVRVETRNARLDQQQVKESLKRLVNVSTLPQVAVVQIDFDATVSERKFYRQLLTKFRQQLPASMPISITALTSWCIGDQWITGLPVDEAVPMLFRMGTGQSEVTSWMASAREFPAAVCRDSLGISTDEPWKSLPTGRRVYAFSPKPWNQDSLDALNLEIRKWH